MHRLVIIALITTGAVVVGCTDSKRATMSAEFSDQPADITCWSYGTETYNGRSTGRVTRRDAATTFVDAANGRLTAIEGDCRIVYLPKTN
ncbi:hypothetical protein OB03_10245 [Brevundimonas sp. GN22]|uniref:hypothetical protein n=1 Tax=Brevundimonas pishanensis TaxID=2896315 RepID=UPI001FA76FD3|nr:hypothetical protein [Brevundimonas pishanensis]